MLSLADKDVAEDKEMAVGDLQGLSPNAQRMVKMAVLAAWAQLQVASSDQPYLVEVVKPHAASLTPLWLSSLQDFARLRFEPDISSLLANTDDSLDMVYAAFNRQTLLKVQCTSSMAEKITNACGVLSRHLANTRRRYRKLDRAGQRFCL